MSTNKTDVAAAQICERKKFAVALVVLIGSFLVLIGVFVEVAGFSPRASGFMKKPLASFDRLVKIYTVVRKFFISECFNPFF
jgi:hypothetical protein